MLAKNLARGLAWFNPTKDLDDEAQN
jgi:hypothetical protein